MSYTELIINVEPKEQGSDVLIAELSEIGFDTFTENELGFSAYIETAKYSATEVNTIFSNYSNVFKINFKTTIIEQQNWNKEWESSFQPIDVDGKCIIRAPFHAKDKEYEFDIIIEPKMSFGTGHHNTTQLMIQKLMKLNVTDKALLDMGCGTGVLAILAAKMNAKPITAIDIDNWSFENTLENLEKNNINSVDVHKGNASLLDKKVFHTILANINKNVLLSDMAIYTNVLEKNGNLLLSGFFETDINELTEKAFSLDLSLIEKKVNEKWAMLHFTKNN
ncbi:MAG: 50S ribosomal protein L11 methyltransferase [Bacteroidia bacterium]